MFRKCYFLYELKIKTVNKKRGKKENFAPYRIRTHSLSRFGRPSTPLRQIGILRKIDETYAYICAYIDRFHVTSSLSKILN